MNRVLQGVSAVVIMNCLFAPSGVVQAQQNSNGDEQGTLPPIVVTPPDSPPEAEGDSESSPSGAGDIPPVVDNATPRSSTSSELTADFSELSYPSLSGGLFGQSGAFGENTGILRGATSLFDTPAAASIRTREEILERQAPDMFHALQNEVGVLIQSTAAGQASPFIRGLTGQQILILVDGIRLNNSIFRRGPNQYFNTIDPGMVDHIEVLRGQGSVLWGSDAIGGAINVVTRGADQHWGLCHGDYAQPEYTQYFNSANSAPYSRMNVEGWVGRSGFFGGGSFLNVRDLDTGFDQFGRQPGTNYQQYAGDINANYLLNESSMLTVSLQHFEQKTFLAVIAFRDTL